MASPYAYGFNNPTANPASYVNPEWVMEYMTEWLGTNRYNKLIGTSGDKPIHMRNELKARGEFVKIPLLAGLRSQGVANNMPLKGRETVVDRHIFNNQIHHWRNGIAVTEWDERRSAIELFPEHRRLLMDWSKWSLRDHVTDALFSTSAYVTMNAPLRNPDATQVLAGDPAPVVIKAQANAAQKNTWLTDNADRVQFGIQSGVPAAGNFAGSMAALAATDIGGAALIEAAKDKADLSHLTSYGIEPISLGSDDETGYIMLCDKKMFKQIRADNDIKEFNKSLVSGGGKNSGQENPYFSSGDLLWNNVIIKEIAEMGSHYEGGTWAGRVNTGGTAYGRGVLLGKQAICMSLGDDVQFRTDEDDYGHVQGAAIRESLGIAKVQRELDSGVKKDFGVITVFSK